METISLLPIFLNSMLIRKVVTFLFFLPFFLFAQKEDLHFEHLSMKDGLSMNPVMSIIQDNQGFMWFGTQDGLNKYDGYKFTVYKSKDTDSLSISDNFITSQCLDYRGRLFVGTLDGLNIFDTHQLKFKRFVKTSDYFSSKEIHCLYTDKNGLVWIGTGEGLALYDPVKDDFISVQSKCPGISGLNQKIILCIYQDKEGTYWFGTNNGLIHYIPSQKTQQNYLSEIKEGSLSNNTVLSIYQDLKGTIWIGTLDGLNKFDKTNNSFKTKYFEKSPEEFVSLKKNNLHSGTHVYSILNNYGSNTIRCITEDKEGYLWLGTDIEMIAFNPQTEKIFNYKKDLINPGGISDHFIRSIFIDKSENLWVGTLGNGLNKVNLKPKKFQHYQKKANNPLSLSENYVRSICEDANGHIWVGTLLGGLNRFDPDSAIFHHYTKEYKPTAGDLTDNNIRSICFDAKENCLWIGTNKGLDNFNLITQKTKHYEHDESNLFSISENTIRNVFIDSKGNLWCGTENGLNLFNRQKGSFKSYNKNNSSISNNTVWKIIEDRKGKIWLATNDGLNCFDPASETFFVYKKIPGNTNSLSHNSVRTLYLDKDNFLWVGTQNGLNKFNFETLDFTRYNEADGLPNPFIYGIVEDDKSHLWITTNKGITEFDKQKIFKNYDISDGLQDYEFNTNACFKSSKGEMYFGGPCGLNRFHPQLMKVNTFMPPVLITELKIQDYIYNISNISELKGITLNYDQNNIYLTYSSLDYTNPSRNQYMCKLQKFNKNWENQGNNRFISYTNLDPGKYIFMVKGSNSDGIWNEKITTLNITILPPFWKTWWFNLICVAAILFAIYFYTRLRTRALIITKRELETMVKNRTIEVEFQKSELAQKNKDITDSINYAKRIQNAILPNERLLHENFEDAFVFYKPRDIVSGDLYWFAKTKTSNEQKHHLKIIAAVDCTGHGVPGAFMSLIAFELLNQTVKEKDINSPADVLRFLNKRIPFALNKNNTERLYDGMDVAVCAIDTANLILYYSGANRPLWIISNKGEFQEIKPTKVSVGGHTKEYQVFENHTVKINKGDTIYFFSDGYADQFGGTKNKKIGTKKLKELLLLYSKLPLIKQKQNIETFYEKWKAEGEQIDDIMVFAIKI